MKTWTLQEKNKVEHDLWVYQKRYEDYKKRNFTWKQTKNIVAAIRSKKKTLALLEERKASVKKLAKEVEAFFGVSIWHKSENLSPKVVLAKSVFYKMGLESGHVCSSLAWYTGCCLTHPSRQRKTFQKSFDVNTDNKKAWVNFRSWKKLNDDTTKMDSLNSGLSNRGEGE